LYWCPKTKSLVCGNCNNPTLTPVSFWNLKYAYTFYCDNCKEDHFDLYFSEFQGTHPWQNNEFKGIQCVSTEERDEKIWKPSNIRLGTPISIEKVLKQENKALPIRKMFASKMVGGLNFHTDKLSENEITQTDVYKQWEEASSNWLDLHQDNLSSKEGDFNRQHIIDPALWEQVGEVKGLTVLDAGCGNGYLSRKLAQKGAKVIGVDHSKTFISHCNKREEENPLGCQFYLASLDDLKIIESSSIDLIISNIVFIDVLLYKQAFMEFSRVLGKKGRFIWSNVHPVFGRVPNVFYRLPYDTPRNEDRFYVMIDRYFDSGGTLLSWGKMGPIWQFDRTLSEYSKALKNAGFLISEIIEPKPSIEAIQKYPRHLAFDADRIPFFIIFDCLKVN
jgi:ubiquinone/menaquinone biosynthesis C-methylase UbiE